MKKIAILHPKIWVKWGAIKTLFLIGNHLAESWNKVEFFCFYLYRDNCFPELNKNLKINDLNASWFKKFLSFFSLAFKLRKFDIVLAGNSPMHFVWVIAKFFKIITFWWKLDLYWLLQNVPVYYLNPELSKKPIIIIKRFLEKLILPFLDKILVNSNFIQNEVKKNFNKECEIIYPCIDTDFFVNDNVSLQENLTIFTYSRLVSGKNIKLAIIAYKELLKYYPGLKLVIWWDWEDREMLMELAQFHDDIQFLWEIWQQEVKENLQKCAVFLFTSLIDAFGLTILESMSMQKAVVALNLPWARELIWHGWNWFLAKDEEEFIRYINELLKDIELRNQMWQKWREWAQEHFSLNKMFERIDEIM